jgi:hypothetical protein
LARSGSKFDSTEEARPQRRFHNLPMRMLFVLSREQASIPEAPQYRWLVGLNRFSFTSEGNGLSL